MGFAVPFGYGGVARLKPGVGLDTARAELNLLIADLPNAYPGDTALLANIRSGSFSTAVPLKDATIGSARFFLSESLCSRASALSAGSPSPRRLSGH